MKLLLNYSLIHYVNRTTVLTKRVGLLHLLYTKTGKEEEVFLLLICVGFFLKYNAKV